MPKSGWRRIVDAATAIGALILLASAVWFVWMIVSGGHRIRTNDGSVVFGWHADDKRFMLFESPKLALDGPHAFVRENGYEILRSEADRMGVWRLRRTILPMQPAPRLEVRVDNPARTRFEVTLREEYPAERGDEPRNPSRLLILSDFEGQFDRFVALLQAQGVIDAELRWRYGDGHVALVGDFVDRGDDVVPLLWLIYRLEGEAAAAGGRVHYVLGNHEQFKIEGYTRDWPLQVIATANALGEHGAQRLFGHDAVLGRWLRAKPVLVRIGDHLLVHAGISAPFLAENLDVAEANRVAQAFHAETSPRMPSSSERAVIGSTGLTWYRGMASSDHAIETDPAAHLRAVLARYGVRRVAIGHTIAEHVSLEQGGGVLRLDVHHATQTPEAALYENGRLWRVDAQGGRVRLL